MHELIIDSFAGGGGASLGIQWGLGRSPDVAINHDADAIAMHAANHPEARHFTEDVWKLSPRKVTGGRAVGLLWASPDCKHFSRAKGGKPVEKRIRSLAWVVVKWAIECRPRLIVLENVREFEEWGPLVPRWHCRACDWRGTEGQAKLRRKVRRCPHCDAAGLRETLDMIPDPKRKGLTFKRFVGRLRNVGYDVRWKVLNAADFGAPTHRRRLFLIARCDGQPVVWPKPTHQDPAKIVRDGLFDSDSQPWRTAAECIDWSIPCPSIFDRKKPLADATMRRIAMGIRRYVLDNPRPFLVSVNNGAWDESPSRVFDPAESPLTTVTSKGKHGLVTPFLARISQTNGNGKYTNGVGEPLTTIVSKNEHLVIAPTLIQTGYGERDGQAPRSLDLEKPMGTVVAGGAKQAMLDEPLHTATSKDRFGVVTVSIEGQPYVIVDIGMRMLTPRELARGQGFPDSYTLTGTKTTQVAKIGNSVPPIIAKAIVESNYARGARKEVG